MTEHDQYRELRDEVYEAMGCSYCHSRKRPVNVHGHEQCQDCHTNISPCCGGEANTTIVGPYIVPDGVEWVRGDGT